MTLANDKASQLFAYLRELCALKISCVSDVSQYDEVFWFDDIPTEKLCHCIAWKTGKNANDPRDERSDLWVEVHKPDLKAPPEVPDELERWITADDVTNSSLKEPRLFSKIPALGDEPGSLLDHPEILKIEDSPEILELWINYVESEWKPWAAEDQRLQRIQNAYNRLFTIYQRQEKLGEQYEIVVGVGLLSWQSPASGPIRRHIVSLQARVEFDSLSGIIIVQASLDGARPSLECEMLDTADRPEVVSMTKLEDAIKKLDGNPWDGPELENTLHMFANMLSTQSRYESTLKHVTGHASAPAVSFSPAIILRKRTRRTFVSFYEQMIEQIQAGGEVPDNVRRIIEIIEDGDKMQSAEPSCNEYLSHSDIKDIELYFPLPSNSEQRRIAECVDQRQGILVQGPPGTGKSHTIANLISHFLAKGKRVLVTSETPRALNVLRNKLPEEIRELCVVWLGSGKESQDSLEQSVQKITQNKIRWDSAREQNIIVDLQTQLNKNRQTASKLTQELQICREADTYRHDNVFGYCGTLQKIAIQVNSERQRFEWLLDRPASDLSPKVTGDELLLLLRLHRQLTPDYINEMTQALVPLEKLMEPKEYRSLVEDDCIALNQYHATAKQRSYPGYELLKEWDVDARHEFLKILKHLVARLEALSRHYHSFADRAAKEIAGDQDRTWRELLQVTESDVQRFAESARRISDLRVTGIENRDTAIVRADAYGLKTHLDTGKRVGLWLFRPQVVKNALYLMKEVRVDGRVCDNSETLGLLLEWLDLGRTLQGLGTQWSPHCTPL